MSADRAPYPAKIYLINSFTPNQGDLAILLAMLVTLQETFPAARFTVAATDPGTTAEFVCDAKVVRCPGSRSPGAWRQSIALAALIRNLAWLYCRSKGIDLFFIAGKETRQSLREYLDADLIIGCGGGYLNDNFGPAFLGCLWDIHIGNLLRKPVVLYSVSIGPYRSRRLRAVAGRVLDRVSLIICRNAISARTLREMGVARPAVYETADVAVALPPAEKRRAEEILRAEAIVDTSRIVTVTVTAWPFPGARDPGQEQARYLRALGALARHAAEKYGATALFVPMDVRPGPAGGGKPGLRYQAGVRVRKLLLRARNRPGFDELEWMRRACREAGHDGVKLLEGRYGPGEVKAIIGLSRVHVATRMHSSIFAAAAGTPVLGIAYEPKMRAFLESVGQGPFILDIAGLEAGDLIRRFDALWENAGAAGRAVRRETEALQRLAGLNAGIVRRACDRQRGRS